jgi:hypothetical protein
VAVPLNTCYAAVSDEHEDFGGGLLSDWQEHLQLLWSKHKDRISFCVGNNLDDALRLLQKSFPAPLPTGPADDAICSNNTLLYAHMCGPQEIGIYLKVVLSHSPVKETGVHALLHQCFALHSPNKKKINHTCFERIEFRTSQHAS